MKKLLVLVLAFMLACGVLLSSCGETANNSSDVIDNSVAGGDSSTGDVSDDSSDETKDPVTIVYGGNEDQIMIRELAEKFTALPEYSHVTIDFHSQRWMGMEALNELAATNALPDIIQLPDVYTTYQNQWCIDLNPFVAADDEAKLIPDAMINAGSVNDKLLGVPTGIYAYGIIMNTTILERNNVPIPDYDWTVDEMIEIGKKTTVKGESIGLYYALNYDTLAPQINDDLAANCYNPTTGKYEFGEEFIWAMEKAKEQVDAGFCGWEEIEYSDAEDKAAFAVDLFGTTDCWTGLLTGYVAMYNEYTWIMNFDADETYTGFEWDYYPIPVKEKGDVARPLITCDLVGITVDCENAQEAFDFVKFGGFGEAGFEARKAIISAYDKEALQAKYPDITDHDWNFPLTYYQMPATTNQEIIDSWLEFTVSKPGLKYIFSNLDNAFMAGPASGDVAWSIVDPVYTGEVLKGTKSVADVAPELERIANETVDALLASIQ